MSAPTQAPQDWRALPAGAALDGLVAARVFGWVCTDDDAAVWTSPDGLSHFGVSPYSTSIAAAWQVVEKLRERGAILEHVCVWDEDPTSDRAFAASFDDGKRACGRAFAMTAPLAICRAALVALEAA
jgi:hypothetical protein